MTRTYDDLKRHLFFSVWTLEQQADIDEMFFGPHDEYTKRSRSAAMCAEKIITSAGLSEEFERWKKQHISKL